MTGLELQARRTALELSADRLAEILGRHPDEIGTWESIRGSLPGHLSSQVEWALAQQERIRLIIASGLEECAWVERRLAGLDTRDARDVERRFREVEAHARDCAVCQRRQAFVATLPPLPPFPVSTTARLLGTLARRIHRLPVWARPAATGALILGIFTIIRALLTVVVGGAPVTSRLPLGILVSVLAGAYGGVTAGVAYALVRGPSRRLGRAGDYLTGVACASACVFAFAIPLAVFADLPRLREPATWGILIVLAAAFGVLMGHHWFRTSAAAET
jgi:hypothetical protein